jgi:hypothetical protein
MTRRRKRHSPEQIVHQLPAADAMPLTARTSGRAADLGSQGIDARALVNQFGGKRERSALRGRAARDDEPKLIERMRPLARQRPRFGSRRITAPLRADARPESKTRIFAAALGLSVFQQLDGPGRMVNREPRDRAAAGT